MPIIRKRKTIGKIVNSSTTIKTKIDTFNGKLKSNIPKDERNRYRLIESLGEEKMDDIANRLRRYEPITVIVNVIQKEWGDYTDLAVNTLKFALRDFKNRVLSVNECDITENDDGSTKTYKAWRRESIIKEGQIISINPTFNAYFELEELLTIQKSRLRKALEFEATTTVTTPAADTEMGITLNIVKALTALQMDTGLMPRMVKPSIEPPKPEDNEKVIQGELLTNQVEEAVLLMQEVFAKEYSELDE